MTKQMEMAGIDNELSSAAAEYVGIMMEQGALNDRKEKSSRRLLEAMTAANKTKIRHQGMTLKAEYIEAKWKVKASKKDDE